MTVGIVYDSIFKKHVARFDHPECPERLDAVVNGLKRAGVWEEATHIVPVEATVMELCTVHEALYVERLLQTVDGSRRGNLDPDTFFSAGSRDAALRAAGGAIEMAKRVHDRELDWGFAAVRPPGHHAESNRACGFCMLNNIAIAAGVLLEQKMAARLAIVDWDVHHGNGTQQQFYSNPDVLYISIHQWPHFPGSGLSTEMGTGEGVGKNVNVPFPPGMGDVEYADAFERLVLPLLHAFRPEHILVSAGFDAHRLDFLSGMRLSTEAYQYMTRQLKEVAQRVCDGRISFYLEGGYQLNALSDAIVALCDGMRALPLASPQGTPSSTGKKIVDDTIGAISASWGGIF
ncbi:MAG: histone deacetylase [Deltaproteobacteria bacterium]|nr:histone deacetylase [Deltaproteobacteria bacterium]